MSNGNPTLKLADGVAQVISERMPEVAATELKKFIERAERTADELNIARADLERTRIERDRMQSELKEHRSLDTKLDEIKTKTSDLEKRELQLALSTAENRALVAEGRLDTGMKVMELVFRNTTVSQRILGTVPLPVEGTPSSQYNPGCAGYVGQGTVDQATETTRS